MYCTPKKHLYKVNLEILVCRFFGHPGSGHFSQADISFQMLSYLEITPSSSHLSVYSLPPQTLSNVCHIL
jgi:hypothetical protein